MKINYKDLKTISEMLFEDEEDREKYVKAYRILEELGYVPIEESNLEILLNDSTFLGSLEENGVDNWEGYDDSLAMYDDVMEEAEKRFAVPYLRLVKE